MSDTESTQSAPVHFLDTVEGEMALFRAMIQTRPVGRHKHLHMLAMLHAIKLDSGRTVTADDVWEKLRTMYELDLLEDLDLSGDELDERDTPPPETNYNAHPRFKEEFTFPEPLSRELEQKYIDPRRADPDYRPTPSASPRRGHSRKASDMAGAFDSEGELTEEDDERTSRSGRKRTTGTTRTTRKRSQTRSEGVASSSVQQDVGEDVEMESADPGDDDVADSPAASITAATTRSARGRAAAAATSSASTTTRSKRGGRAAQGRSSATRRGTKKK